MLSQLLAPVTSTISDLILQFNYLGLIAVTFIENIIAPIPSEFVFPWAGFLAAQGKMNIWLIALAGAVGSLAAALTLYWLGSRFNGPKTRQFVNKYGRFLFIKLEDLEKAEKWFEKYGPWTVLIFRMIPLARTIVSIPAGFVKMNVLTFGILTFIGTFLWSLALTYAGFLLGENWESVAQILGKYQKVVLVIIGVIAGIFVFMKARNRKEPGLTTT